MKNSLGIIVLAALVMACGNLSTTTETNESAENTSVKEASSPAAATDTATEEPTAVDDSEVAAEEIPEPKNEGPERIRFRKGASEGTVEIGLGGGEKKRFVIGVTAGQHLEIEIDDYRPMINMISTSKVTDVDEEDGSGHYYALTTADGDIVFEIENISRSSVKTKVKVSINDKVY